MAGNLLVDRLAFPSPIDAYATRLLAQPPFHPSPQTVELSEVRDLCSMMGHGDKKEGVQCTKRAREP